MTFLVDTNVNSEIRRKEPDQHVTTWLRGLRTEQIFLSVLTLGELRTGILRLARRDAARARALDDWVSGLEQTYGDRILPVTHAVVGTLLFQSLLAASQPIVNDIVQSSNAAQSLSNLPEIARLIIQNGVILYALTRRG